jgi:ureidoacrylate peracid hydrolase
MDRCNEKTALILVDLQNDFCHPDGTAAKRGKNVSAFKRKLENIKHLLETARETNISVIHVISEHSVWTESPSGKERFGRRNQNSHLSYCEPGSWGGEIHQYFIPKSDEKVVAKHRYSAFLHTELELILQRIGIEHIVITGGYTNVCIDTTARDAYMRDFFVSVPYDCVISDSEKLHNTALELLNGTFADVIHSSDVKRQWKIGKENTK